MEIGDLVILKSHPSQLTRRLGVVIEKSISPAYGLSFFIFTIDGIMKFADYELELLNGNR